MVEEDIEEMIEAEEPKAEPIARWQRDIMEKRRELEKTIITTGNFKKYRDEVETSIDLLNTHINELVYANDSLVKIVHQIEKGMSDNSIEFEGQEKELVDSMQTINDNLEKLKIYSTVRFQLLYNFTTKATILMEEMKGLQLGENFFAAMEKYTNRNNEFMEKMITKIVTLNENAIVKGVIAAIDSLNATIDKFSNLVGGDKVKNVKLLRGDLATEDVAELIKKAKEKTKSNEEDVNLGD